ncbi:MAG: PD40 domain-containing protein, partial [Anaerolineales bacterium]|nr:PD40 domain-containing protein [Anaerolineales bacterium]
EPERIVLQEPGKVSLDGCQFLQGDEIWFCSAREGNYRGVDLWRAEFRDGRWLNWENAGEQLNVEYKMGEFHFTPDWETLYFHSDREGGFGNYDIWVTHLDRGEWAQPENVSEVNSDAHDSRPFISPDGSELWITRTYLGTPGIFRSRWMGERWSQPELILSQFAGEPTLDAAGNLYFIHHYIIDDVIIEADVYVAHHK